MWLARLAVMFVALVGGILAQTPARAADLTIFTISGTDADPLTGAFPLALSASQTKTATVLLWASRGAGFVGLNVNCCIDVLTGAQVSPPGLTVAFDLPVVPTSSMFRPPRRPKAVWVVSGQTTLVNLKVTTSATAAPGQYTAKISASNPVMGTTEQTIYVNVLGLIPADSTTVPCSLATTVTGGVGSGTPPAIEVLPVSGAVADLFRAKAASPTKTSYQVGARAIDNKNGWILDVNHEDPVPLVPLKPDEAVITFANDTNWDKDFWTINSAACSSPGQHIHAAKGQSATIKIRTSDTTTLLLRRDVCALWFIGCWSVRSEPVAVFSEPPFWSLVGGRVVKVNWVISLKE